MTTETILNERAKTHGSFAENARIAQHLKVMFRECDGWADLPETHRESLDMITLKLARILSGKSEIQHWEDVAGYAELVVRDLSE